MEPADFEEIAEEFDEVPHIKEVNDHEESFFRLQRDLRLTLTRPDSRRNSFIQMKSETNLLSAYLTNAFPGIKSRQNALDVADSISNYSEAPSMKT